MSGDPEDFKVTTSRSAETAKGRSVRQVRRQGGQQDETERTDKAIKRCIGTVRPIEKDRSQWTGLDQSRVKDKGTIGFYRSAWPTFLRGVLSEPTIGETLRNYAEKHNPRPNITAREKCLHFPTTR